MSNSALSFAIVAKYSQKDAVRLAKQIALWLVDRGHKVFLDDALIRMWQDFAPIPKIQKEIDFFIVIGGDGTLMSVARKVKVPILGVKMGRLGFLTEISADEVFDSLHLLVEGNYKLEKRFLLKTELKKERGTVNSFFAFNDVVVVKSALERIIDITVEIDGSKVADYRADGIIIATPAGSTAYNLSAGGPLVAPELEVSVITPICPHALYSRSLVVPVSSTIGVSVGSKSAEVFLVIDGQEGSAIAAGDRVLISNSEKYAYLVRFSRRSFYDHVRMKFGWG